MRISDWSSDVCSSDLGLPIRFPKPQYGPRKSTKVLAGKLLPYSPIADVIDFSIQCNPIFMYTEDTKAAGANRPLAPNTLPPIAAGVKRLVIDTRQPYTVYSYGPKTTEAPRGR